MFVPRGQLRRAVRREQGDVYLATHNLGGQDFQQLAMTGTADAASVVDLEQGAVRRAQDQRPVAIEKAVGYPVELQPAVRAAVAIGVHPAVAPDDKKPAGITGFCGWGGVAETLAGALGNVREGTQAVAYVRHRGAGLRYALQAAGGS